MANAPMDPNAIINDIFNHISNTVNGNAPPPGNSKYIYDPVAKVASVESVTAGNGALSGIAARIIEQRTGNHASNILRAEELSRKATLDAQTSNAVAATRKTADQVQKQQLGNASSQINPSSVNPLSDFLGLA